MASVLGVTTYDYSNTTRQGDVAVARYAGGTTGSVIETATGVVTSYTSGSSPVPLPGDTKAFQFSYDGDDYVLIAATSWNSGSAVCTYLIFNGTVPETIPSGYNWGSPVYGPASWAVGTVSLNNLYKIQVTTISSVFYMFGIDYDGQTAFRLSTSTGLANLTMDTASGHHFTFSTPTTGATEAHGVDLVLGTDKIFTLWISGENLTAGDSTTSYLNSTVVATDMDFGNPSHVGPMGNDSGGSGTLPGKNAFSIQPYSYTSGSTTYKFLLLTAVGGAQHHDGSWNPDSCIQKVDVDTLEVDDLLYADTSGGIHTDDQYDFRALAFASTGRPANDEAFVLTGKYDSTWTMNWRLYHMKVGTLLNAGGVVLSSLTGATFIQNSSTISGYLWALLYSSSYNKIWFSQGNQLAIYGTSGQVGNVASITSLSSLGSTASLNAVTIYNPEEALEARPLRGYVAPAFASNAASALIERRRILEEMKKTKK